MQDKHLFEYAVIRVVPRVEREEFFNVGIILYCKTKKYLNAFTNWISQSSRFYVMHSIAMMLKKTFVHLKISAKELVRPAP